MCKFLGDTKWVDVSAGGCIPAPRTILNVAAISNRLYIFGGGLQGARPVTDTTLHVFDAGFCLPLLYYIIHAM